MVVLRPQGLALGGRRPRPALAVAVALAALVSVAPALNAQTPNRQLTDQDRKAGELQAEVARLKHDREQLSQQLVLTARLIQASEAQLSAIEQRKGELEAQESLVRGSLEGRYAELSKLLAAMQRMGRNPPPVMITRREDILGMVRSAKLLGQAYPEIQDQAAALSTQLSDLAQVRSRIETEGEKLRAETQRLSESRTRLVALIDSKKQVEADKQAEFGRMQKAAAEITRGMTDIPELLGSVDKLDKSAGVPPRLVPVPPAPAPEATPVAPSVVASAPEAQAQAPPRSVTTTDSPAPQQQAALPPPKAAVPKADARLPPVTLDVGAQAPRTQSPIEPRLSFDLAKGKLASPAQGRRVVSFGERTQRGKFEGIAIETRHGAQVISPADGRVVYAGEFRSYGQVLIINPGGGYHILLANLSQLDVTTGQFLVAGEPVGTMAPAPKALQGRTQDSAPVLYVEFRKDQRAIDPDPWWMEPPKKNADAGVVRPYLPQFSRG